MRGAGAGAGIVASPPLARQAGVAPLEVREHRGAAPTTPRATRLGLPGTPLEAWQRGQPGGEPDRPGTTCRSASDPSDRPPPGAEFAALACAIPPRPGTSTPHRCAIYPTTSSTR